MSYTDPTTYLPISAGGVIDPNWGTAMTNDVKANHTLITTGGATVYGSISLTTSVTIASGTATKLNLATTASAVGITAGSGQFTVVTAGPYLVVGSVNVTCNPTGFYFTIAQIKQNTTVVATSQFDGSFSGSGIGAVQPVTALVIASIGDTISLWTEQSGGGASGTVATASTSMYAVLLK